MDDYMGMPIDRGWGAIAPTCPKAPTYYYNNKYLV